MGFDKDKNSMPISNTYRKYLNTGYLEIITVRTPRIRPSCLMSYVHYLEVIKSSAILL